MRVLSIGTILFFTSLLATCTFGPIDGELPSNNPSQTSEDSESNDPSAYMVSKEEWEAALNFDNVTDHQVELTQTIYAYYEQGMVEIDTSRITQKIDGNKALVQVIEEEQIIFPYNNMLSVCISDTSYSEQYCIDIIEDQLESLSREYDEYSVEGNHYIFSKSEHIKTQITQDIDTSSYDLYSKYGDDAYTKSTTLGDYRDNLMYDFDDIRIARGYYEATIFNNQTNTYSMIEPFYSEVLEEPLELYNSYELKLAFNHGVLLYYDFEIEAEIDNIPLRQVIHLDYISLTQSQIDIPTDVAS